MTLLISYIIYIPIFKRKITNFLYLNHSVTVPFNWDLKYNESVRKGAYMKYIRFEYKDEIKTGILENALMQEFGNELSQNPEGQGQVDPQAQGTGQVSF